MKASLLYGPKQLKLEEVDIPKAGPGEVLLQIKACGVCPTEVKKYLGNSPLPRTPFLLGHEAAGVIAELGEGTEESGFKVGDRVITGNIIVCGECPACKNGQIDKVGLGACHNQQIFGVTIDGGYREYAPVPVSILYRMPDDMSFTDAVLVEPIACCKNAVDKADIMENELVLVLGAGFMGLAQLLLAKLKGARVVITDFVDERLDLAKELGADLTVNPSKEDLTEKLTQFNNGLAADVVLCTISGKKVVEQGLGLLNRGARLIIVGGKYPPENAEVDINDIHYKQASIIGAVSYTDKGFREVIDLLHQGKLHADVLQSEILPPEKLEQAFNDIAAAKGMRKCIVYDDSLL